MYIYFLNMLCCKAFGKDPVESDQEENLLSASDTESNDEQKQPDSTNKEGKPLQLLGDEVFESLEIESLETFNVPRFLESRYLCYNFFSFLH